jgi:copper ion binding protein
MTTQTFRVKGMTCDHCVTAVQSEVRQIGGVELVHVDLAAGSVEVTSVAPVDRALVAAAIDEAGYELAS